MANRLKAFGLVCAAVLAVGAVMASAASAGVLMTEGESYPVSLHGTQTETKQHVFTLTDDEKLETKCSTATFTGELTAKSSTVTVHPEYSNCKAFLGVEANVTTTGCNYQFHIGATTGSNYDGTADIVCSGGAKIIVESSSCEVQVEGVAANQGLSTVEGINGSGNVKVEANVKNINYKVTRDGLFCPLINGKTSGTEGDYTGLTTVTSSGAALTFAME